MDSRKLIIKLSRENQQQWEELKELKISIITEIKQVQNEISALKNMVERLTNRMNATEERISDVGDNQYENTQLVKYLEENLNKINK